jgi:hypothetical protein
MKCIPLNEYYIYEGRDQIEDQKNPYDLFYCLFPDDGANDKQVKTKFNQCKKIIERGRVPAC